MDLCYTNSMKFIDRPIDITKLEWLIGHYPITSVIGPRQCGKTTMTKLLKAKHYFDLENPRDLARLEHPQLMLESLRGLIVIDEVQRKPDLFPLLRYLADKKQEQSFLLLGSASPSLIKHGSETLAGRIAYYELTGLRLSDIGASEWKSLWLKGSLPLSYLYESPLSEDWRSHYITSFLERDLPALGITIPSYTMRKFWLMITHYHGQVINFSELARSFGISDSTARKYLEILHQTFMVRILPSWYINTGKRLVKNPKIFIRDSGLYHSLTGTLDETALTSSPRLGASWEGFALEESIKATGLPGESFYYWRTHNGAELDLYWEFRGKSWGIECKYTDAPAITKSIKIAFEDLGLSHLWIIYPGTSSYELSRDITVLSIADLPAEWRYPSVPVRSA